MTTRAMQVLGCAVLLALLAGGCGKKSEGGSGGAAPGAAQPAGQPAGGGGTIGACVKQDELAGPTCDEHIGFPPDQLAMFKDGCSTTAGAKWVDGPCPRDKASGACSKKDAASGTSFDNWYYADSVGVGTPDDVKKLCADNGLEFIAP